VNNLEIQIDLSDLADKTLRPTAAETCTETDRHTHKLTDRCCNNYALASNVDDAVRKGLRQMVGH